MEKHLQILATREFTKFHKQIEMTRACISAWQKMMLE
jgi:hypothetical protein